MLKNVKIPQKIQKIQDKLILQVRNQSNRKKFLILAWHMKLMLRVQLLQKLLVLQLKMQK